MHHEIAEILRKYGLTVQQVKRTQCVIVSSSSLGFLVTQDILRHISNPKTALFLSGGRTPKDLYTLMASEKSVIAGSVGMIDERFGEILHPASNERMLQESGLLDYFIKQEIPFHPILQQKLSLAETALQYNQTLEAEFYSFKQRIGILGIGLDGHTAGIPARSDAIALSDESIYTTEALVTAYDDTKGMYGKRVTLTFSALRQMSYSIVLVFGRDKEAALREMIMEGPLETVPARIFNEDGMRSKTIVITDILIDE